MYCFEKAAEIEIEPFLTSRNVSTRVDISQSHVSKSTQTAYKRGVF